MRVEQISPDLGALLGRHRAHFLSGKTRPVEWREAQLAALSALITENAENLRAALWTDLRRNWIEADLVDTLHVAQVPIELGSGERLWDSPDDLLDRYHLDRVPSPSGVTHLTFDRRTA